MDRLVVQHTKQERLIAHDATRPESPRN